MPRDLSIYDNSEYVYAAPPIGLAFPLDKGDREIAESKPSSMICSILTRCLNMTDVANYIVSADGH